MRSALTLSQFQPQRELPCLFLNLTVNSNVAKWGQFPSDLGSLDVPSLTAKGSKERDGVGFVEWRGIRGLMIWRIGSSRRSPCVNEVKGHWFFGWGMIRFRSQR